MIRFHAVQTRSRRNEKLKEEQRSLNTRVKFTQDTQDDEKTRVDQVCDQVDNMKDQIKVLQGMLQIQEQKHLLSAREKESKRMGDLDDKLLISGLDEEDANSETVTSMAEMVTDFFLQNMMIPTPIMIKKAERIGKLETHTVLVTLSEAKDKSEIFKHAKNLKDVRNNKDDSYYVNNQLTPKLQEQEWWYRLLIKYNSGSAGIGKWKLKLKRGKLLVMAKFMRIWLN